MEIKRAPKAPTLLSVISAKKVNILCKRKRKRSRNAKGFMLLELIIVVAIIGILAAVAIPNLVGMTDKAKVAKIQSDLSTIGTAMEVYHVKKGGTYPTDLSTLAGDNGYLKKVPEPPTGAGAYTVGNKGEVTCTFNGVTYSSFGTSTGSADSDTGK